MNRNSNAKGLRHAALGAAVVFLSLHTGWGLGQRAAARAAARQERAYSAPPKPQRPAQQRAQQRQLQNNPGQREAPVYRVPGNIPSYPGVNGGGANVRPVFPGNAEGAGRPATSYPGAAPPGHLGDWLNQHRSLPAQDQERLLRNDPSFNRLPEGQQQRLVQQLHQLNEMPEQQRERRLARAEAIEHMSPEDRSNLNQSNRAFAALPPDRQAVVKRAFQDLRSVPLDQRETVLNSARYQGQFSPEERGILTNFLRVEPYEAPH